MSPIVLITLEKMQYQQFWNQRLRHLYIARFDRSAALISDLATLGYISQPSLVTIFCP